VGENFCELEILSAPSGTNLISCLPCW